MVEIEIKGPVDLWGKAGREPASATHVTQFPLFCSSDIAGGLGGLRLDGVARVAWAVCVLHCSLFVPVLCDNHEQLDIPGQARLWTAKERREFAEFSSPETKQTSVSLTCSFGTVKERALERQHEHVEVTGHTRKTESIHTTTAKKTDCRMSTARAQSLPNA